MRNFKKYFFESLLQLTILANVFRQNSRFTNLTNDAYFNESLSFSNYLSSEQNSTFGQLDLLFQRDNYNLNQPSFTESNSHSYLNNIYRSKEAITYEKDLQLLHILNKQLNSPLAILNNPIPVHNQNILLLPASFLNNSNNQKDLTDLTETRLLLNSIELNLNNPVLKKEFEMDIELQTLIEQDIDLGIHKNNFYYMGTSSGDSNEDPKVRVKNSYDQFGELDFKNEDILATTKYIEDEKVPDDYKLFVEEDTGELFFVLFDKDQKNTETSFVDPPLFFPNESNDQSNTDGSLKKNINISLNFDDNRSIFDPPGTENGQFIEKKVAHDPLQVVASEQTRPLFLSEISVCKALNNLNEENEPNNINNNNIIDESLLAFNDTILNDLFESNALIESNVQNYQSFEIQSEFYNQQEIQQTEGQILSIQQNQPLTNQSNLNSDQQFLFEDQFLKDFEANLNKFDSNEYIQNKEQQTSIRNDQTIGGFSPMNKLSPIYIGEQVDQQKVQIQNETEPFIEQLNINDLFKFFDNSNNDSFVSNSNNSNQAALQLKSFIMDSTKINTTNDDEAKILNVFKQEFVDIENAPVNLQNSRLISMANIPETEELTAAIRGFQHNHTYLDGIKTSEDSEVYHPYSYKNKLKKMLKNMDQEEANQVRQQESRDQLLLHENNINASLTQVVDSNADEFNELVKELQLESEQLTIIKDIRRRGKNKVAAQICRKRKIDSIESLKEDVEQLSEMKVVLESEHENIQDEIRELTKQFDDLYKELMGENHDINDPMMVYMNSLKIQLSSNNNINNRNKAKQSNLLRNLNSDHSDSNSDEYESSDPSSTPDRSRADINSVFDDVIEVVPASSLAFDNKIKKFRKY